MNKKVKEFFERFRQLLIEYDVTLCKNDNLDEAAEFFLYFYSDPTSYYKFCERSWFNISEEKVVCNNEVYVFNGKGYLNKKEP